MTRTLYSGLVDPHSPNTQPEQKFESRWHQPWSEPVRQAIKPALAIALIASGAIGPVLEPNSQVIPKQWLEPWSEPVRQKIDPKLSIALIASGPFAPVLNPNTQITQNFESRWHYAWSEPVRLPTGIKTYLQEDQAPLGQTYQASDNIGWHRSYADPVRVQLRNPIPDWQFPAQVTVPFTWSQTALWPDFAPRAKSVIEYPSFTLGFPPPQVWYPPSVYPDIDPYRAKPSPEFPAFTFGFPPPQVWFPSNDRWPDTAPAAKRVAQNPDWSYGTFVTPSFIPTYTQWTQWPDFAPRAKAVVDFIPWTFLEPPPQVFYPPGNWADFAPKAKPPLNFDALALVQLAPQVFYPPGNWPDTAPAAKRVVQFPDLGWAPQTITAQAVVTFYSWTNWPDFAPRAKLAVEFSPWTFTPQKQPVPWTQWFAWPDVVPSKPKPPVNYLAWSFIPTPQQVFFPPGNWPDSAPGTKRTVQFPDLGWAPQTITATVTWTQWAPWPDLVPTKPRPPVNYLAWSFIPTPRQVWFPTNDRWPDRAPRKQEALNYIPLALTQTVRTPWNTLSTWPDFVPIRGKIGIHAAQQQVQARFAGTIAQVTVTGIMAATEINTDQALFAINIVPFTNIAPPATFTTNPAASAIVSIQEIEPT